MIRRRSEIQQQDLHRKFKSPPAALKEALPIVWPTEMFDKSKAPASELKNDPAMSGSFASCVTRIVKSVVTEHEESASITSTKEKTIRKQ